MEGRNQFTLTWLRNQSKEGLSMLDWGLRVFMAAVRTQARKTKKRLGPGLNKAIKDRLDNEVGYKLESCPSNTLILVVRHGQDI